MYQKVLNNRPYTLEGSVLNHD